MLFRSAFFGIGAYASALLALHAGLGFLWGMALGIVVAGVVGALIALPALRVSGDYLVIVSFGLQTIVFSVMLNWQEVTRGGAGLPGIPRPGLLGWKVTTPSQYLVLFLVVAALCLFLARRLTHSPFGRVLKAMDVGVRAINGLLTVGQGQRIGIMAGSGVGKSVLLGMIGRVAVPGLTDPNTVLPTVLTRQLPPWLGALALSAIFSTEVDTCDAILFMIATSASKDLYKR